MSFYMLCYSFNWRFSKNWAFDSKIVTMIYCIYYLRPKIFAIRFVYVIMNGLIVNFKVGSLSPPFIIHCIISMPVHNLRMWPKYCLWKLWLYPKLWHKRLWYYDCQSQTVTFKCCATCWIEDYDDQDHVNLLKKM